MTAGATSLPESATVVDPTVWRVVGAPLIAPTGSGPLDGTSVAVKDVLAVAGQRLGAGNPTWLAQQAPRSTSAPAVAALLRGGAAVRGIAHTDEFAYSLAGRNAHYGTPPNPAVPSGIGGGSTSGPAAAVALGEASVGLGTDTAGSIRVPASYQGLVGIRTTHGAVPTEGMLPLAPSFDTIGWLTRDVGTALRVAHVLLPGEGTPLPSRTITLRGIEAHAWSATGSACGGLRTRLIREGVLPPPGAAETGSAESVSAETVERWFTAFRTLQAHEAWREHGGWVAAHPGALGAEARERFLAAEVVGEAEADRARIVVAQARVRLRRMLADAVLVLPAAAGGAPARTASTAALEAERGRTLRLTCLAGLAGAPAVSVPVLYTADARPIGLCLVGAPDSDLALLRLAERIETVVGRPGGRGAAR